MAQTISPNYRLFLGVSFFVFIVNVLIMNDLSTIWNGAEVFSVSVAAGQNTSYFAPFLHLLQMDLMLNLFDFSEFTVRISSVFWLVLGLAGLYFLGKKIFGEVGVLDFLLVIISSLLVVNMAKLATGDVLLFVFLSLGFVSQVLYLKQPQNKWKLVHIISLLMAIWTQPFSSFFFFLSSNLVLWFFHPQGKRIKPLSSWLLLLLALPAFIILLPPSNHFDVFYLSMFSIDFLHFIKWSFLGMLPWIGFLVAGLWDYFNKLRKKEEFAIVVFAWLIAGLSSFSLALQAAFALIVAKQLRLFFTKNYPYRAGGLSAGIVQLVAVLIFMVYVMISGFDFFGPTGFRSAMAAGAVYWMPALAAVIGLLSRNRRLAVGGMALSGLMVTLLFWVQVYPLVETQRNLVKRVVDKIGESEHVNVNYDVSSQDGALIFYLKNKYPSIGYNTENSSVPALYQKQGSKNFPSGNLTPVAGWRTFVKPDTIWINRGLE